MITKTFIPFQQTKNVIFFAAKKMDCCMYQEKMNFLFTMNQNRKSGTLSPMPFHSPGMLLIQPKFPAVGKAEPRKGRRYGGSERATIRKLVTELCANYDSQDKICLPLDSPCYMLNKWWTGAYCRYFEKAVLPVDAALESAITGEDTSMRQKICPVCGKAYLPTTSQAYCSAACRVYARRKSERERKRRKRQNQP